MADYSLFMDLADSLLHGSGVLMQFVKRRENGKIDALTGKRPVTETVSEFYGLISSPRAEEVQAGKFQQTKMVILAAGKAVSDPDCRDLIRFSKREYAINEIITVAPAGEVILYKFGVADMGEDCRA